MQGIREVLERLDRAIPTPDRKITDPELTLAEKREQLRQDLGVSSLENTFGSFKFSAIGTEESLEAFKLFASGVTQKVFLLCYGGVGNGKTHLCEATVIELYRRGIFCRVLTMAKIMRTLKSTIKEGSFDEILDRYCRAERLIIDDAGMGGSGSEWEWGVLEDIIASRYRDRLFTIMTTNMDLTNLPERVVSRFMDAEIGMVVLNSGKDYRGLK